MHRTSLRIVLALVLLVLSATVVACGGGDEEEGGGGQAGQEQGTPAEGQRGGRLTQLQSTDVDYLDPGHTYYTAGFQVAYATHKTLYSFRPGSLEPQPDLAEAPPEISDDQRTVTVRIKRGVRFAPPVNREVTSEDVKYAIERFFTENVGGQYTAYFDDIVGSPESPGDYREIRGIETPDAQTIVFRLKEPSAVPFSAALVMPVTAPVPEEYARRFDRRNPSTYNTQVVATGPYMVRNNAQGRLIGYRPGRSIELVRNPNWSADTDFRPAYLDEILLRTNASDANVSARQVLAGQNLAIGENPPAPILGRVVRNRQQRAEQLKRTPSGGYRYFPMNTTLEPLDDINVRKAIIAGFDRTAARLARGGEFVGPVAQHYIPPGIDGFEESGGERGFTEFDWMQNPRGNMTLAQEYMRKAGYASGRYEGNDEILIVTGNADPNRAQAEVAQAQLEKLGFRVRLRQVPTDAMYTEWCQVPRREVHICGGAGWFKDFNDPQSMLEPTFKGSEISPTGGNNNLAQLDVPEIDRTMTEAALKVGEERAKAFAEVNRLIVAQAPAIPFLWDVESRLVSENVNGTPSSYFNSLDLSFSSIKQ